MRNGAVVAGTRRCVKRGWMKGRRVAGFTRLLQLQGQTLGADGLLNRLHHLPLKRLGLRENARVGA